MVAALSVSGLSAARFAFEGFLPAKRHARCNYLEHLSNEERTLVFYEAPHRLVAMLGDVVGIMGSEREVAVARELTKLHEETVTGTAAEVLEQFSSRARVRGELVVMVGPALPQRPEGTLADELEREHDCAALALPTDVRESGAVADLVSTTVDWAAGTGSSVLKV